MIQITNPADCCGCSACASICNHDAIDMKPDVLGFHYPEVDVNKCTNCGLCEKVCAFNANYDVSSNYEEPICYGARHKDLNEVSSSRSGAAFIALSDWILANAGVVYGAGFADHFRVVHKRATTPEERNDFKGSKYVQSDMNSVFRLVKKDLKEGRLVLFSGTSCQTAGLKSYIGKRLTENLYLLDIICHGVPSPNIWQDYLAYMEKKYGADIVNVNFRDKSKLGWANHKESLLFSDGRFITSYKYTCIFYQDIVLRKSCGKCYYANTKRPSDITIADFWGWQKTAPEFNRDNKGVSLVMCNTEKGQALFNRVKECMYTFNAEIFNCMQPNLQRPTPLNPKTERFKDEYSKYGFEYVFHKYGEDGWRYKYKKQIKYIRTIPSGVISKIKDLLGR